MTAAGVTTRYELDAGRVLSTDAAGNITFYLYGPSTGSGQRLGPIGELADTWNYSLPDGTGTPRPIPHSSF